MPGDGTEKYAIAGLHDADQSWMRDVRSAGRESGVRILPRVMFERFSPDEYLAIFQVCYSSLRLAGVLLSAKLDSLNKFEITCHSRTPR